MLPNLTEIEEQVRLRHEADRHPSPRHPVAPYVPTRTRVAARLRRVADRLDG
jgi:hypothetical protein